MRAEIEIEACGGVHTLALPIGGLEEVAKVNPYPVEVWQGLTLGVWKLDELRAVLKAGCKWGRAAVTAEQIIEDVGLKAAAKMAADLMAAAFHDDSGNSDAAAKSDDKSEHSSSPAITS